MYKIVYKNDKYGNDNIVSETEYYNEKQLKEVKQQISKNKSIKIKRIEEITFDEYERIQLETFLEIMKKDDLFMILRESILDQVNIHIWPFELIEYDNNIIKNKKEICEHIWKNIDDDQKEYLYKLKDRNILVESVD